MVPFASGLVFRLFREKGAINAREFGVVERGITQKQALLPSLCSSNVCAVMPISRKCVLVAVSPYLFHLICKVGLADFQRRVLPSTHATFGLVLGGDGNIS